MAKKEIVWEFIEEEDLSYLKQPEEVYNVKHSDYYCYHTDGNSHYRRIFYGVEYSEFEKRHQKQLKEQIENENIELPEDWDDAQTLKYCYSGGFDLKKSIESLKMHLEWRRNPIMHKMNKQALEILQEGVFYHLGRDKQFRPVVVLNMWKVNPKKTPVEIYLSAICNLLTKVSKIEFVKGYVESWVVILETNEKGVTDLELATINKIVQIMAKNFTSTLEKMFITNPSFLFSGAWSLIKNFIHPETSAKINILKKKDFHIMLDYIDADQLEEKYGGTLPNKTTFWPPQNTLKQTINNLQAPVPEENGNIDQSSMVSFKTIDNDSQLFFDQQASPSKAQNVSLYTNPKGDVQQYQEIDSISKPIQSTTSNNSCCKCNIF
ncbi:aspartyl/asparaginyl beta-hydroxylase family protein (macronuclear) [Tetrahymena thermophila SB210]|uniref:Aspartyl/asparaginyl beta-hydroxylase family protein n=1 Tax=Tetrahymena thermophila (strain SB210) TaxID=312017 RepID=W7X142_TETTS|nr:aspartyl/asparaginyl beta-hydroxylase family protein [Tetrahymena thermophila SB210]EWS72900.1 aspartyl/asparaginyl beta-hydroxylase family protein [Tetrahymena thermophila SB210]|eukprot:XP_012654569.1 aspartyl/asparaginyl beta-hydroxylase family protein [Tetrahymena thermophila SB210]